MTAVCGVRGHEIVENGVGGLPALQDQLHQDLE